MEVDHPSQSTLVILGNKQKWYFLWCPWSQVQQDISGPDTVRRLGCLWAIHHRCTCKWDWTEMLTVSFPLRTKTVWNPFRMNKKRCWRDEGHNSYPLDWFGLVWFIEDLRRFSRTHWNGDCLLEDFSGKTTKILSIRNLSIFMMSSSEYLLLESECSFTKYISSSPNTKYLYLWLPLLKRQRFG